MRNLLLVFILIPLALISCKESNKDSSGEANNSKIEFENNTFNFGKIDFASDGTCVFTFTNTSTKPLLINVVRTSCGCTNPEWPKESLEPGESGVIKVIYNTRISGSFQKSITVFCNAENSPVKLIIKGEVLPNPEIASSSSKL